MPAVSNKRLLPIDTEDLRKIAEVMVGDFVGEIQSIMSQPGKWKQKVAKEWGYSRFDKISNLITFETLYNHGLLPVDEIKSRCGDHSLRFYEFAVYEIHVVSPPGKGTVAYKKWMDRVNKHGMSTAGLRKRKIRVHATVSPSFDGGQACQPNDVYVSMAIIFERVDRYLNEINPDRVYSILVHEMTHMMDPTPYESKRDYGDRPSEVRAYARGWAEELKTLLDREPNLPLNDALLRTTGYSQVHRALYESGVQEALRYVYQELIRSGHIKE